MNEWVSIEKNKPELGQSVIVYLEKSEFITIAYRTVKNGHKCWQLFGDTHGIIDPLDEVSFWMLLPNKPK